MWITPFCVLYTFHGFKALFIIRRGGTVYHLFGFFALHSWVRCIAICRTVESLGNVNQIFRSICSTRFHEYCMQASFEIRGWKFCKTSVKGCDEYSWPQLSSPVKFSSVLQLAWRPTAVTFSLWFYSFFPQVIIHRE